MAKVKIERCEYWEYLPTELKRLRRKRVGVREKNVLSVLIFHYYLNSDYRKEHNGWFYCSQSSTLAEETNMDRHTVQKAVVNLIIEHLICTTSGKNVQKNTKNDKNLQKIAKIVHFKFGAQVLDTLEIIDDFDENYMDTSKDKIRRDESSKDESSQDKISREERDEEVESDTSELPF